jgi:hypothetical protein
MMRYAHSFAGPTRGEERLIEQRVTLLMEAGATIARRHSDPPATTFVMRDPNGNEFCLV